MIYSLSEQEINSIFGEVLARLYSHYSKRQIEVEKGRSQVYVQTKRKRERSFCFSVAKFYQFKMP